MPQVANIAKKYSLEDDDADELYVEVILEPQGAIEIMPSAWRDWTGGLAFAPKIFRPVSAAWGVGDEEGFSLKSYKASKNMGPW